MKGSCVPTIPGRPIIVKVINRELTLTWTEPDNDGGAEITGYLIAYTAADGSVTKYVTVGVTTTAKLENEFVRKGSYLFAVAAKNTFGTGDFSSLSEKINIPNYFGK